jgi:hypothetical protein
VRTLWPRTEWAISPADTLPAPADRVLVGDGPAFPGFEAAFSSFFYQRPAGNYAGQGNLWRISQLDLRGRLHRITVTSNAITVVARGAEAVGAVLELSSSSGTITRPVGRTGQVRLRLPSGLADGTFLVLRRDDDWLDYRHFNAPFPGVSATHLFPGISQAPR